MSPLPSILARSLRRPVSRLVATVLAATGLVAVHLVSAVPAQAVGALTIRIATSPSWGYEYVSVAGASSAPGAPLIEWPASGPEQIWTMVPVGDYFQIVNGNSGQCIYADGIKGDWLYQEPCNTNDRHELWDTDIRGDYPVPHGIRSFFNRDLYMDVEGGSSSAGSHLIQWVWTGGSGQRFGGVLA